MADLTLPLFANPVAGRGRAGKRLARIVELLAERGIDAEVRESGAVGDLERGVADAVSGGADRVLVVGGDGSIHEATNGLLAGGDHASIGIIPSGTGNDFAKAAGIPLEWDTATQLLADRIVSGLAPRRIDVGRVNGRYFANGAGIGFDARITRIARGYRWPVGDLVYLLAIFRGMVDAIATPTMSIRADGFEHDGPLTLANVSNGPWIGGMFHIAPPANNEDGRLELVVVAPVTRRRIVALLPKLMRGTHLEQPEIAHRSVERVQVECAEPVPSHLDGEVQPLATRFEIEVLPGALRLL
ncbi:MAG: diacylglycerol kinase family lipid kinase [Woeseiaceae bacterium]|nr:diacylglycerol kinase family lipid kinase [Woeseiaceae bacterium]